MKGGGGRRPPSPAAAPPRAARGNDAESGLGVEAAPRQAGLNGSPAEHKTPTKVGCRCYYDIFSPSLRLCPTGVAGRAPELRSRATGIRQSHASLAWSLPTWSIPPVSQMPCGRQHAAPALLFALCPLPHFLFPRQAAASHMLRAPPVPCSAFSVPSIL